MNPKESGRDASGVKNISAFIIEVGERIPAQILPCISVLLPHLDGEVFSRINPSIILSTWIVINSIFLLITSLSVLHNEKCHYPSIGLSYSKGLTSRWGYFRRYQRSSVEYPRRAFSRCKFLYKKSCIANMGVHLQVRLSFFFLLLLFLQFNWIIRLIPSDLIYIYREKAVPLSKLEGLTALTISRLRDKASHTRKNALQLVTTLLQYNPYGPSLRLSDFSAKLKAVVDAMNNNEPAANADKENAAQNQNPLADEQVRYDLDVWNQYMFEQEQQQ